LELVERLAAVSRSEGHVVLLRRARRLSARQVLLLDRRQARDAPSKRRVSLRESGCADLRLQRGTCRVGVLRRVASRRGRRNDGRDGENEQYRDNDSFHGTTTPDRKSPPLNSSHTV